MENKLTYNQDVDFSTIDNDQDKTDEIFQRLNLIFKEYLLSDIQVLGAFKFIKDKFLNKESKDCEILKKWIIMKLNQKEIPKGINKHQLGCPDLVPAIRIKNFWDPSEFDWVQEIVKHFDEIKEELLNLRTQKGFQPYKSPSYASEIKAKDNIGSQAHNTGDWNVFYLFLHEIKFDENCKRCPRTIQLIKDLVPRQY